jgi:uncharacterized phage protein (TIGR02220 family)
MAGFTYVGKLKNSFICDKRLSGNDIRVYLSLKKWESWEKPVKVETMAKEIKMTRKSFSKCIKNLEKYKYVEVVKNSNWDCHKYKLLSKAHVNKLPTDVGYKIPINDGKKLPPLIKTICNTKEIKKEKTAVGEIPYDEILDYLKLKAELPRGFSANNGNKKFIKARWKEGQVLVDFKTVIDVKCKEWLNTDMAKYLRPETLFGNKFESYLNQPVAKPPDDPNAPIGKCL